MFVALFAIERNAKRNGKWLRRKDITHSIEFKQKIIRRKLFYLFHSTNGKMRPKLNVIYDCVTLEETRGHSPLTRRQKTQEKHD